jgi:RNA polymerase sigma-70 factor (ECF subfamily)
MASDEAPSRGSGEFPSTAWTFIRRVQEQHPDGSDPDFDRFLGSYWKPVFYFLRTRGLPLHEAEDVTQAFFLRFLEGDWLKKADQQRGKFRTFLLTLLNRFLSDQSARRSPRQEVFDRTIVSVQGLLGDAERTYEPADGETPEAVFMRKWAATLVDRVLKRLQQFYEAEGRAAWYKVFTAYHLVGPGENRPTQTILGARYGMTRDQVRYAWEVVEKRFEHYLRDEIGDEVAAEADIGDEIRELLQLLQRN